FDGGPGVGQYLDVDVTLGQRAGDLVELLGRKRDRARRGNARIATATNGDVEVRRGDAQCPVAGVQKHVGEDRNRVLALDDPLDEIQLLDEIGLADDGLHS